MELQDGCTVGACGRSPAYDEVANRWTRSNPARPDAILAAEHRPGSGLTALEIDVLDGLIVGLSEREIALRLMLFEPAVRAALRSIYRKLRVRNRADAVAFAATHGGEPLDARIHTGSDGRQEADRPHCAR